MSTGQQGGGPSLEERFWIYLAERTGGVFEAATRAHPNRVVISGPTGLFVVDSERGTTRCRVLYTSTDGFRFRICTPDIDLPTRLRQMFGAKDVEIGVPYFDKKFVLEATDPAKIRQLLDDAPLREQISDLRRFDLTARTEKNQPENLVELRLTLPGREEDVARLQYLQIFTASILQRLRDLGSVAPTLPTTAL